MRVRKPSVFKTVLVLALIGQLTSAETPGPPAADAPAVWVAHDRGLLELSEDATTLLEIDAEAELRAVAVDALRGHLWTFERDLLEAAGTLSARRFDGQLTVRAAFAFADVPLGRSRGEKHASVRLAAHGGTVWLALGDVLHRFDENAELRQTLPLGTPVLGLAVDAITGELRAVTGDRVLTFDATGQLVDTDGMHLGEVIPEHVSLDGTGGLWALAGGRLHRFSSRGEPLGVLEPPGSGPFVTLAAHPRRRSAWLATREKLIQVDAEGRVVRAFSLPSPALALAYYPGRSLPRPTLPVATEKTEPVPERPADLPLAPVGVKRSGIESTFDTDTDGWTVTHDGFGLRHVASGGNPGGYISAMDQVRGGFWYWKAPEKFLGDVSEAYGKALTFDLKQSSTSNPANADDVVLEGSGKTLVFDTLFNPGTDWTSYKVPLSEAGWRNRTTRDEATEADMRAVLSDLEILRIRGEYRFGSDTGGLDNPRIIFVDECAQLFEIGSRVVRGRKCEMILNEANELSAKANPPESRPGETHFSREETELFFDAVECRTGVPAPLLRAITFEEALGVSYANPYPRQFLEPCEQTRNKNGAVSSVELWQRYYGIACPVTDSRGRTQCTEVHSEQRWPLLAIGTLITPNLGCEDSEGSCPPMPSIGLGVNWCSLFPKGTCTGTDFSCIGADDEGFGGTPPSPMPSREDWVEIVPAIVHVTLGDDRQFGFPTFGLGLGQVTMAIDDIIASDRVTLIRDEVDHDDPDETDCPMFVPCGGGSPEESGFGIQMLDEDQIIALIRDPQFNLLVTAQLVVVKWQQLTHSAEYVTECHDADYGRIITLHNAPTFVGADQETRDLWTCSVGSLKAASGNCSTGQGPRIVKTVIEYEFNPRVDWRCFGRYVNDRQPSNEEVSQRICRNPQSFAFAYACNELESYAAQDFPTEDPCRSLIDEYQGME